MSASALALIAATSVLLETGELKLGALWLVLQVDLLSTATFEMDGCSSTSAPPRY